jgi:hypothetical protein
LAKKNFAGVQVPFFIEFQVLFLAYCGPPLNEEPQSESTAMRGANFIAATAANRQHANSIYFACSKFNRFFKSRPNLQKGIQWKIQN